MSSARRGGFRVGPSRRTNQQENDFVDLSSFERLQEIQDAGRIFPILDAAGSLTDIRVKVAGPDSERQRDAKYEADRFIDGIRASGLEPTQADFETYGIMRMTAAVMEISNLEGADGKPLESSPENVEMLLQKFPAFRDQIQVLASTRALYSEEVKDAAPPAPAEKPARKRRA